MDSGIPLAETSLYISSPPEEADVMNKSNEGDRDDDAGKGDEEVSTPGSQMEDVDDDEELKLLQRLKREAGEHGIYRMTSK